MVQLVVALQVSAFEILRSVRGSVAPHHRSPIAAIKPAGQDPGAPMAPRIEEHYRSVRSRKPVLSG